VTERGRSTCAEILDRLHTREAQWLARMPEPHRRSLIRLLGEVKGLLNSE
jgi:hypothetical protein